MVAIKSWNGGRQNRRCSHEKASMPWKAVP